MKKIVQINATSGIGSTGKICIGISQYMTQEGMENHILYDCESGAYPMGIPCGEKRYIKVQALKSHLLGNYGFNSSCATQKLIAEINRIRPDLVHLHNLHGHGCHLEKLFSYFRENHIRLVWTFHDCWAFTAYCPYFTMVGCDKWKIGCSDCPQRKNFSWFFDRSAELYRRKKELFAELDLTIVTPSEWLVGLVKQSFLKEYPVTVIPNGIDLSVFKPLPSAFRKKFGIPNEKFLLLGVAFDWGIRKGLDVFIELAGRLPQERYQIVLVGTNEKLDRQLPPGILSIHRTQNQTELAEIYTAADLFVNPTREDNYPTVNMEALACGTPVLTFRTGGSPEMLDETCGSVVACDDIGAMEKEIIRICEEKPFTKEACLKRAAQFDMNERFREYVELYQKQIKSDEQK